MNEEQAAFAAQKQIAGDPAIRVHAVVMPLVRAMRDGNLSWSDKEEIAGVIRDVMREAQAMRNEQFKARDQAAGMMAGAGGLGLGGRGKL